MRIVRSETQPMILFPCHCNSTYYIYFFMCLTKGEIQTTGNNINIDFLAKLFGLVFENH